MQKGYITKGYHQVTKRHVKIDPKKNILSENHNLDQEKLILLNKALIKENQRLKGMLPEKALSEEEVAELTDCLECIDSYWPKDQGVNTFAQHLKETENEIKPLSELDELEACLQNVDSYWPKQIK